MKKIIVWGLGDRTDKYLKFNYFDKAEIIKFQIFICNLIISAL